MTRILTKKLEYSDIEDIVEYLVKNKAQNYTFDCWGPDDIAQEIRIICFNALSKFDASRVEPEKWQNFFGRCVDNGLKNLKRDNYIRAAAPYKKQVEKFPDGDNSEEAKAAREKLSKHKENMKRKLSIRHAMPIDDLGDVIKNNRFSDEMEYKDLESFLLEKAHDDDIAISIRLILSGRSKEITKKEKRRVQSFVKHLLDTGMLGEP